MALQSMDLAHWRRLPARLRERGIRQHTLTVIAAGVAFYAFLALVPTLILLVSLFGLVAEPADIQVQVEELGRALPESANELITDQLVSISRTSRSSLTVTAVVSTLVALWSASSGVLNLMRGVSVASGTVDIRNLAIKRGIALMFMLGAVVFLVLATVVVALLPALLAETGLAKDARTIIQVLRFPVLALMMMVGLGLLYHYAEPVSPGRPRLVSWGTVIATTLWVVFSTGFSFYTANFGRYNEIYGSLGAVVVLLLWLWLTSLAALIGAEIDSEIDATVERGATPADTDPPAETDGST
jgi:membrane protein